MTLSIRAVPALTGCRIAVAQHPRTAAEAPAGDAEADRLDRLLRSVGAELVVSAAVREDHPIPAAVRRTTHRVASGRIDAVYLETAPAARSWMRVVERLGAREAVRERARAGRLAVVAAGAPTVAPLAAEGLRTTLAAGPAPEAVAEALLTFYAVDAPSLDTEAGRVGLRSGGVLVDGRFLPLPPGAVGLLEVLMRAEGRVLSRTEIGRTLPGGRRSARAVEVSVARLREALGEADLVQTVVKRGYRLAVTER
ncbi:winged helix-turn-helix domain-containing protein [Microbacterium sp. p3-SID336]|uniref:winged helix-turn-helix domain-containing protein n=1 Tax=Microbacterium sp. p3-SID336 TaxID=2916212 RepID=UPI0021A63161|nr:winged helix-turn-helix domain-containing protein [Microbacterium sp. p3-SID336]MCT1476455.1 winged helix-turn-helix domain-containing protein [Microbacterium sp. p3-SID336]